ncbi:retrovirus-related pol polyprotein from transposon RE1 [Citrus sinensis]|uniref:Retrovirus-related pol polyprotein from transposon RE1 n=1 Tax=Citrus sinensis TaxID=2711 RepID=A0ACB8NDF9_CITSI|nr:retrovirus-related pol polyprotein from transposon RE1 [Citrus sinensis]
MVKTAMTGTSRSIDSSESAETSQIPSLSTPTIVHTAITENTSLQITSHKLNGKNFLPWSRSVQMVIRGRGKLGYLLGQKQRPDENDPAFQTWDAENSIVMAWLVNSMEPNIGQTYLFYQTTAELWEAVKETYSDLENSSQLFELRNMARNLKQGDMDVTHYFNSLKNLWQELDLFNECEWSCIDDGARYKKLVDKDRIYDFLAGLNKELDDVRGRILGTKPLPSIREIFAEVRREESCKRVMLGEPKSLTAPETSALAVQGSNNSNKGGQLWCDHCHKPNHTKEHCWRLHGKPTNWKDNRGNKRSPKGFQSATDTDQSVPKEGVSSVIPSFTKEQLEQLQKLLTPIPSSSLLAQKGIFQIPTIFHASAKVPDPWIIDSGATDHMTGCIHFFSSYAPSPDHFKVRIADGSLSVVAGMGTIKITPSIILKSVLHVPKLSCNLLSVSKITKDLNCVAHFSHSSCEFQDLISGRRIGSAREHGGLYYFEDFNVNKQAHTADCGSLSMSREQKIMLWHRRPFAMIHSDIWGPSRVSNLTGYSATQKGYRCYSPEQHKYFISMDVTFFETHPFYAQNSLQGESSNEGNFWEASLPSPIFPQSSELLSPPKLTAVQPCQSQSDLSSSETTQNSSQPMKSTDDENFKTGGETQQQQELRVYSRRNNPQRVEESVHRQHCQETELNEALRKGIRSCAQYPISNYVTYDRLSPSLRAFVTNLSGVQIPKNIQEALEDSKWRQAVIEEMSALEQMGTWELVQKPEGKVPVGCKWVFTVKYRSDGSIERYKARLVAKGFTQTYGIDYQETFAPVAKLNTIRVLLSLAANLDWPLQQLDVKNAFLNGDLAEEVYMELPPGFDKEGRGLVCRLKKSLYGLKQSPRAWFDRFSRAIRQQEYKQAQTDHTLFYRHKDGKITVLIVYVDDIILTGNDIVEIKRLKKILATEFDIKDLGSLRYFLGMEVARNNTGISVSQRKYVIDLLKETGMIGCKPVDTPMDANLKLGDLKDSIPVERGRYQRLVGKLIYLSHTRPDIAFAVSVVSQFMHAPCEEHMEAVYRILRYLKGTPGKGLLFKKNEARSVEAFTDADWAGSIKDRRSTSGYCTFVWGNLVTWRSEKQSVVARSSAEAEFRAVAQGICELLWLKLLLGELKIADIQPMKLYCDNKAAIDISHNPVHHDRTKHVEVDRHFIKEKIEGVISMTYVPTSQQTADLLTKGLVKPVFEKLVDKLGMFNVFCPA